MTVQGLLLGFQPPLILWRVQKPFASSGLSPPEMIFLLKAVVDWCEPVQGFFTLRRCNVLEIEQNMTIAVALIR